MRKILNNILFGVEFIFCALVVMTISYAAIAQVPAPSPAAPSVAETLLSVLALIKSWNALGIYAGIAAALKLLIDAVKSFGFFDKIPAVLQGLFVVLVGAITVGLTAAAAGATLPQAIGAVVGSSAGAMLFNEIGKDIMDFIKSKFAPKA